MSDQPVRPVVVLVGPPGAGKTTVGQRLAKALGTTFRDTDQDIVASVGKPIAEVFIDDGEEHFRALEKIAVAAALKRHDGVVSLGGGAVLDADTRALLKQHRTLLLQVDLSSASSRVGMNRDRPVLALNPRAQLKQLLDARMPLYLEVATDVVDTSNRSARQVADEVAALLAVSS